MEADIMDRIIKDAINRSYKEGLADGFKRGAVAALDPQDPEHGRAVKEASGSTSEPPQSDGRVWRED